MAKAVKIRAKLVDGVAQMKALMSHPMESGLRRDAGTGEVIPAHYIREVVCEHNGEIVLTAHWGTAVSRNPYVAFKFTGAAAGDTVRISWQDNRGESAVGEVTLK